MDGIRLRRATLHPASFALGLGTAGLAALAASALLHAYGVNPLVSFRTHCSVTGTSLHALGSAVGDSAQRHGDRLPASLELLTSADELGKRYLQAVPDDPWGRAYVYETQGDGSARIASLGEDGLARTGDDIAFVIERGPRWVVREATSADLSADRR